MPEASKLLPNAPGPTVNAEGEWASLSPREGGKEIEGEGGDPVSSAVWSGRSVERGRECRGWEREMRLLKPEEAKMPGRFEAELL